MAWRMPSDLSMFYTFSMAKKNSDMNVNSQAMKNPSLTVLFITKNEECRVDAAK